MRSAIPMMATSSRPRLRRCGSIRWARSRWPGPGGTNLYFKGLLDKLGVTANVYRVGTYKSAVEPFIRNDMSPEARENYQALGQAMLETWRQSVHQARPKANIDLFLKDMPGAVDAAGGDMAKAALAANLVDRIGDRRAYEQRLAAARRRPTCKDNQGGLQAHQARVVRRRRCRPEAQGADRGRHRRRDNRRREGAAGNRRRRFHRPGDRKRNPRQESRRWWCGWTARADRCSPPSESARR